MILKGPSGHPGYVWGTLDPSTAAAAGDCASLLAQVPGHIPGLDPTPGGFGRGPIPGASLNGPLCIKSQGSDACPVLTGQPAPDA